MGSVTASTQTDTSNALIDKTVQVKTSDLNIDKTLEPSSNAKVEFELYPCQTWKKMQTRRHCLRKLLGIAEIFWLKHFIYCDMMQKG